LHYLIKGMTLSFIGTYHRQILWAVLGFLFILDIITTSVGLGLGGKEHTEFMIPFVGNPIVHFIVKGTAFVICWIVIEASLSWIDKNRNLAVSKRDKICYSISYAMIIAGLLYFVILFLMINLNNLFFIFSTL